MISKYYPEFLTVTCLNWTPVLKERSHKEIVIESLRFLAKDGRARIFCFVLMDTHFHLIWQIMGKHEPKDVQRDFLRFTAQQILKNLRDQNSLLLKQLLVNTSDRKFQVWERNSLSIEIRTSKFMEQKLKYIHSNPVDAGMCRSPEDYEYSSAKFYDHNDIHWNFITHYLD